MIIPLLSCASIFVVYLYYMTIIDVSSLLNFFGGDFVLPVRLKMLRIKSLMKQADISSLLKITTRNYQRYEAGVIEPNITTLMALADYFNVSVDYLIGRSDVPERADVESLGISPEEFAIIEKLRSLPPEKRQTIETLLNQI